MIEWISNTVSSFTEWVGSGFANVLEWLLGGLADMFTLIIDAADGIWSVFESLWSLGTSLTDSLMSMVSVLFPFVPEPVVTVISAGLIAVVVIGCVKKVRGS